MLNKRWGLVILAVVTFLAYINIYQNDFISDDIEGILKNENIGDLRTQIKSLQPVTIVNSLVYVNLGAKEPYFHFVSVIIHIANVFLVYLLVSLIADRKMAFFTAFLFALHPVHTEAVTWISGKPYVLYSFFLLLAFVIYIKNKFLILSYILYILALLTTEKAMMFPILIILYIVCFKSLRKDWRSTAGYFIITFVYGLTMIWRLPQRIAAVNPSYAGEAVKYNPIFQTGTAIASYLELFFVPLRLTFYHDTASLGNLTLAVMILITIIFLLITIFLYKNNKLLFFAAGFFVIAISPTLIPINVGWVVAERYFYLGSVGLCIFLAYIILKFKKFSYVLLTIILTIYLSLTLYRNSQWKNEDALWPATVKLSPGVPMAHNNMGDYYSRRGDFDSAIKEFSLAIELRRGFYPEAIHNLGNTYKNKGELEKAEKLYLKAIEINPKQIESYSELAALYKVMKNFEKAEEFLKKVSDFKPVQKSIRMGLQGEASLRGF